MTKQKGFTLMELLIVIGVLGILAAGLLAAIDPFEQLKKARDATNRDAAITLMSGFQRFYATHANLPWGVAGLGVTPCVFGGTVGTAFPGPRASGVVELKSVLTCITPLINDGELKESFTDAVNFKMYLSSEDNSSIMVCFAPEGKATRNDSETKWLYTPGSNKIEKLTVACTDTTGNCLQCFE
ncbi:type II secretion system GspH family protein [Patescibacteria group bacterium]|nr:type II secretion system GspH family protein [Patescibacteria group bacterium]